MVFIVSGTTNHADLPDVGTPHETDEIADNAITLAKMAAGTPGQLIGYDGSGDPAEISGTITSVANQTFTDLETTFQEIAVTAADLFVVVLEVVSSVAGTDEIHVRFNTDAGGNYNHIDDSGTKLSNATELKAIRNDNADSSCMFILPGKRGSGNVPVMVAGFGDGSEIQSLSYNAGANITNFSFATAGGSATELDLKVEIFAVNV